LGLNNGPRIPFTLLKSRVKSVRCHKQGDSLSKMGTGFHSIAIFRTLILQIATLIITPWQSFPSHCGLPTPALRPNTNHAESSGLWQSALKFRLLTLAISSMTISSVAIRGAHTAVCQHRVKNLSAEFINRVRSSPRHFTSRGHLFEASYIFDAQFLQVQI
jgi:hypothetical protein